MFRGRYLWPLAALAALVLGCAQQETAATGEEAAAAAAAEMPDMAALEQAMDDLEAAYVAAYNAQDAAGVAALFAADGMQSPPGSPGLDPAGIEAALAASFAPGASYELQVEREGIVGSGAEVACWGTFTITVTPEGAEPMVYSGRWGVVDRQDPDGTWKIYRHLYNYEVAPPAPEA